MKKIAHDPLPRLTSGAFVWLQTLAYYSDLSHRLDIRVLNCPFSITDADYLGDGIVGAIFSDVAVPNHRLPYHGGN
jgi:hypothetical protein